MGLVRQVGHGLHLGVDINAMMIRPKEGMKMKV